MAIWDATFSTRPNIRIRAEVYVESQNLGTNQSTFRVRLYALETAQQPSYSGNAGDNAYSITVAGVPWGGNWTFDYRPAGLQSYTLVDTTVTVTHDAEGYLTVGVGAAGYSGVIGSANIGSQALAAPRIPKPPVAVAAPAISSLLPTSATASWNPPPDSRGASVDQYLLRVHTNSNVEAAGYVDHPVSAATLSKALTGLTPGTQYYAAVYAHNSQGYSPKSATTPFKTPSGAYAWNGSVWSPSEVLVCKSVSPDVWGPAEIQVRKTSTWEVAS